MGRIHRNLPRSCCRSRLSPRLVRTLNVLFMSRLPKKKIPLTNEPAVECGVLFAECAQLVILLATETMGGRISCTVKKKNLFANKMWGLWREPEKLEGHP